ncbi:MAG: SelB C-terminal domain-containing protein [Planctomycetota bacterium]
MTKDLIKSAAKNKDSVPELLEMAVANGELKKIANEFFLHCDTVDEIKKNLHEGLSTGEGMTMSDIRTRLDTSRKYSIPICEYLDRTGFTVRNGDFRTLGVESGDQLLPVETDCE